ncbi:MAG TPA: hemolysin family protein, partial [Candidatus Sulfotelmatobacter sp.]|nr:hemolysin family protein [Candidatus Sulfotelmatobacter sp.]
MIGIALLIILILFSALFAMAETALTTVSRPRIAHLVELKKPGARLLRRLREDPARLIATVLVGNNLVNISASVLATTMIEDYFAKLGMRGEGIVIGVAIGIMTLFILVFGEITPKTLAIRNAEPLALFLSPVMLFAEWVLYPIAWLLTAISRPFIFLLGGGKQEKIPFITEEEIKTLLIAGEKEGAIEKEEREMISSVFKFTDLTVKQVMTERDKMACIGAEATVGEAVEKIKESGHSRIPVYDQNLNNIVGVVYAKDLLGARASEKIGEYFRQALFSGGGTKVSDLMEQMQAEYKHLAIVVDEFGHTVGLATLEDMVEEI